MAYAELLTYAVFSKHKKRLPDSNKSGSLVFFVYAA